MFWLFDDNKYKNYIITQEILFNNLISISDESIYFNKDIIINNENKENKENKENIEIKKYDNLIYYKRNNKEYIFEYKLIEEKIQENKIILKYSYSKKNTFPILEHKFYDYDIITQFIINNTSNNQLNIFDITNNNFYVMTLNEFSY